MDPTTIRPPAMQEPGVRPPRSRPAHPREGAWSLEPQPRGVRREADAREDTTWDHGRPCFYHFSCIAAVRAYAVDGNLPIRPTCMDFVSVPVYFDR